MTENLKRRNESSEKPIIIPEAFIMPDGMLQCPKCKQTFPEKSTYHEHYLQAHT